MQTCLIFLPLIVASFSQTKAVELALESVASALCSAEAADRLTRPSSTAGGIFAWTADVIALLGALKLVCLDSWAVARRVILSVVGTQGRKEILWNPAELLEVVELADLFEICS